MEGTISGAYGLWSSWAPYSHHAQTAQNCCRSQEWGSAGTALPHSSPSPTQYQNTNTARKHRPYAVEKDRPFGVCVPLTPALQSEQSSSRAPSEPSPSQSDPAFLWFLPAVLGH